ncbi:hypothetical protein Nepgr_032547 [Nepenthes gracilis]|uniref:E2 ubiquitin-conjugating enzyme n=1 Tax=Nepenthes gracilis TaxID=150966 RepID=A0AAD3Y7Z2_NEPGR|nr:hypothetical protein Nepgr_032547 [Nepenthes gracilis]
MAQAARLNLRMQKELKLILSDPPLRVSFPHLCADDTTLLSSTSLSSIDAQIEGPEGTAYAGGIFSIKIQIPERYPFQPPIVTFATPIYHPNIDNGGRICLDILNLPPKGAWQPSLNISTVLTSIGLLLSEPNPDDGLMREASKEYKYNRQAFDHKARTMTEKYAKLGSDGNGNTDHSIQHAVNHSLMEGKEQDERSKYEDSARVGHMKPPSICRKLSLESSSTSTKRDGDEQIHNVTARQLYLPGIRTTMITEGPEKLSESNFDDSDLRHGKLSMSKWQLSMDCSSQLQKRHCEHNKNAPPYFHPSQKDSQSYSKATSDSVLVHPLSHHCRENPRQTSEVPSSIHLNDHCNENTNVPEQLLSLCSAPNVQDSASPTADAISCGIVQCHVQQHDIDLIDKKGSSFTNVNLKRFVAGRKLSLGYLGSSQKHGGNEGENVKPVQNSIVSVSKTFSSSEAAIAKYIEDKAGDEGLKSNHKYIIDQTSACKPLPMPLEKHPVNEKQRSYAGEAPLDKQHLVNPTASEDVIVLDSEDSDEERKENRRPKVSLGNKRAAGKLKAKA